MEGVVWDDAEHYLAVAVDGIGTETVMLEKVGGVSFGFCLLTRCMKRL